MDIDILYMLWRIISLLDCYFLDVSAVGSTNDVDTSGSDMGVDGFAWLDDEVCNIQTTHVDNAYIGLIRE